MNNALIYLEIFLIEMLGKRLREERARLGVDQSEFAAKAGVSKNSQSAYESGKTACNVEYLLKLEQFGVDIGYVLTGLRDSSAPARSSGEAERINDDADRLLEAGEEVALAPGTTLRNELESVSRSENLPDRIRNRADYMLEHLGDADAGTRRTARIRKMERNREEARRLIRESLDRATRSSGFQPSDAVETAILSLCHQLLLYSPRSMEADAIDWPLHQLLEAFNMYESRGAIENRSSLHSGKSDFFGQK